MGEADANKSQNSLVTTVKEYFFSYSTLLTVEVWGTAMQSVIASEMKSECFSKIKYLHLNKKKIKSALS